MGMQMTLRVSGEVCLRRRSLRLLSLITTTLIALLLISPPQPADAQDVGYGFGNSSQYPRRAIRAHRQSLSSKRAREADDNTASQQKGRRGAEIEKAPAGPLFAILSLSDQHISVYNSSGLVTRSKVSTGMPGHRTPTGIFSIIGRERWHTSNIYSGAPMPFMQRITWSGVAMHLGVVPGYPASHGCIRLPAGSAERLWGLTKIGERVVISPHEVAPTEIAHPMLPVPKMQTSPAVVAENTLAKVTEVATAANEPFPVGATKMLNPIEYARALKVRAAADVASATKAVKEHTEGKGPNSEAVRRALAELRTAEAARAQAEAKLAAKTKALAAAKSPRAIQAAEDGKAAAEALLLEATKRFDAANANEALKTPEAREALDAERVLKEARAALAKAQTTAKEAERRVSPISILVSKKDNRVYIRQGLAPLLDAPAIIRNPETPLGTHVYIATSQSDAVSLGWTVVSLPTSLASAEEASPRRGREMRDQKPARAERALAPSNAAQALERIELPMEVRERISELLWTGGSLIISDQPLSSETSDIGTDLVVTMR
jgi:lipoprotein-anchoring transpeptidase ErfK/SrfK